MKMRMYAMSGEKENCSVLKKKGKKKGKKRKEKKKKERKNDGALV
jgi:hypothetical protein